MVETVCMDMLKNTATVYGRLFYYFLVVKGHIGNNEKYFPRKKKIAVVSRHLNGGGYGAPNEKRRWHAETFSVVARW